MSPEQIAANMRAMEAWPEGTTPTEKRLRRLLAQAIGITYGDDGEIQNAAERPWIDFKRDSPEVIEAKLMDRWLARQRKNPVGENDVEAGSVTARPEGLGASSANEMTESPDSRDGVERHALPSTADVPREGGRPAMKRYPLVDADHIRERLRRVMREMGWGQNALARRMAVTNGHLSRVLSGEKEPGDKVAGWLGYSVVTRYQHQPKQREVVIHPLPPNNRSA